MQENCDIFRGKFLSRRPHSDQGVATELARRFIAFLRSSLFSHGAFTARPRRSQRLRRAFTALPLRCHSDFIWIVLPPYKGVIPNPKMVFIFPNRGFFPKLFEIFSQI